MLSLPSQIAKLAQKLSARYVCWAMGHQLDAERYHDMMELRCTRPGCGWTSIK